jgi:phosphoenolpyruvate carboxylase
MPTTRPTSAQEAAQGPVGDQTVSVIRAFTYFSHLANLAEDRHHIRRRAIHERAGDTQEGSIEVAMSRLRWAGIAPKTIARPWPKLCVAGAHRPPHRSAAQEHSGRRARHRPTADRSATNQARAAFFDNKKDALTPRELAANEAQMRARVMQLWQTRLLRFSKLTVADEIENALSYYEATFLREIPKLYANLEQRWATSRCTAFCAWASGLAATATATPTSAPRRWNTRCAARPKWRCATT